MAASSRVLSVAKQGLRRQIQLLTPINHILVPSKSFTRYCKQEALVSPTNPLLVKILQEPISGVKMALDLEENLTLKSDAFFWEQLVTALRSSAPKKAHLVLEWKLEKLLKENERDQERYSELISLCGKLQSFPLSMRVFTSMEAQGIRPNASVFNSLIYACLSSGNPATTLSLFEIMERMEDCKPNLATYNAFISMYSKLGDGKAILTWYSAAKAAGFFPDVQTYELLIVGSVKAGNFADADRFYEEMVSSGFTPNMPILEFVLEGLCRRKKLMKTKDFLKFVMDGGWELNTIMTEKLLGLYLELGRVEEMEELLELIKSNRNLGLLSRVHSGIIRLYAWSDRLDDMEYSVGRMLKEGMLLANPEDVEAVICSYFRREAYERLDLFMDRIHDSHKLAKSTYDLLVAGYRRAGLSEKLDLVMNDMKSAKIL